MPNRDAVLAAIEQQRRWCMALGSPFTASVLWCLATLIRDASSPADLAATWPGDPASDAVPLRLAAALHALALTDTHGALAACYPPYPTPAPEPLLGAIRGAMESGQDVISTFLALAPQTNEVGRSAVLVGGFLHIAARIGLPLRLLEIGASAGLNLIWDHYRDRLGGAEWGDPTSAVLLAPSWQGPPPATAVDLRVIERGACDIAPVDLEDPAQRLRLQAYVWADQRDRRDRLDRAIAIARVCGYRVQPSHAADWLRVRLKDGANGAISVIYHSIMWQYMTQQACEDVEGVIRAAGSSASGSAPVVWLRFESSHAQAGAELRLTLWPGGEEMLLAKADAHGNRVTWVHR